MLFPRELLYRQLITAKFSLNNQKEKEKKRKEKKRKEKKRKEKKRKEKKRKEKKRKEKRKEKKRKEKKRKEKKRKTKQNKTGGLEKSKVCELTITDSPFNQWGTQPPLAHGHPKAKLRHCFALVSLSPGMQTYYLHRRNIFSTQKITRQTRIA